MRFANPLSLLWMAPIAAIIVVMYMLRLRRRDVVVSSVLLWRNVIRDVQANAPFQKLRRNLLLILQLLTVLLLGLALSGPTWSARVLGGRSIVVLLDASASMQAVDVKPDRMELARREARRIIGEMQPGDQMLIVAAGARAEAVTPFTSDRSELNRAVSSVRALDTGTNMRDALNLASSLVAAREASRVDVVTDGGFPPLAGINLGKSAMRFHMVGRSGQNAGIVAVDCRRNPAGDRKLEMLVSVRNYTRAVRRSTVTISDSGNVIDAHEVSLPAGAEVADVFELPEPAAVSRLEVRLDPDDDLAADNRAYAVVAPFKPLKVLLVTEGNPYLEAALKVDPSVDLSRVKLAGFPGPAGYDAVVFDGAAPERLSDGNYLYAGCVGDRCPAAPTGTEASGSVIDADRGHPALRYVHFGRNRWSGFYKAAPKPWAREIASSEFGAAVVAGDEGRTRALWTAFRLDAAHGAFPTSVAYPIFLSNAVRWLSRSGETDGLQVRTGSPMALDPPAGATKLTVTKPDGSKRDLTVGQSTAFDETETAGFYGVSGGGGAGTTFAANLADAAESDIAPKPAPDLGQGPEGSQGRRITIAREAWPWLTAALVVLLAAEWWVFHRRAHIG